MLDDLSPLKLLIIVAVVLLLFGGKKIPELMHGLGKGLNEFKRATQGGEDPNEVKIPEAPKA
jgi:sec-independent protein translocase protein TatA